jgi:MFS family permease
VRAKGPLADTYAGAVALVVLALVPYLALSTSLTDLVPVLSKSIGLSAQSLDLTSGMANAAYAFGTVAAVQLAVHFPGRRLLVLYASLFTVGSVLAAAAWTPALFITGRILQGLCTSLMLIAAVPPLVTGWPARKMPWTGAVALGPVVGGIQAGAGSWKALFWIVAGLGALALVFALLTFEDQPPQDDSAPWDWVAQLLAGCGCAAAFFGAAQLESHPMMSLLVFLPLIGGLAMVAILVLYEYLQPDPLMPVRSLATTLPVGGITIAICGGAASVALVELVQTALQTRVSATHAAMLFWPEFGGALVTALLFAMVFRTRFVPVLALCGLALLAGAAAILTGVASESETLVAIAVGLIGVGVGASVSPALFIAGFSLRADQIQRVFALIELLRGVAAFLVAPIVLHFAKTISSNPATGTNTAIWVCLGIACAGLLTALYVFVLGRVRLRPPRLEAWLEGKGPALTSPPLAAGIRGEHALESLPAGARTRES